jgi:hypothetical protein
VLGTNRIAAASRRIKPLVGIFLNPIAVELIVVTALLLMTGAGR